MGDPAPPSDYSTAGREASQALLTIQSVGVISLALTLVTIVLYWLVGPSFVHLGPRSYPGSPGVERRGGGTTEGDAGAEAPDPAPRVIRGGTREAFTFEGFPDARTPRAD